MGRSGREISAEELLAHAGWLRRLARRLARDADVADDLVQETWVAAVRNPPEAGESVRPWLAKVLRNALRMRARGETRRSAREQAAQGPGKEVPTPEMLVARAEAQRALVDLVLELEEPYRNVVLLHFCEGLSLSDIARLHEIPAGTVRWRLKVALDRLRAGLGADTGSGSGRSRAVFLLALPEGALVATNKTTKIAAAAIVLMLLASAVAFLVGRDGEGEGERGKEPTAPASRAALLGELRLEQRGARDGEGGATAGPAWLVQRDVAPRRVAGRVTFRGAPLPGATVVLASFASESGLLEPPRRTSDADGRFDFGPQPAMIWHLRATAPSKTGASLHLDLRDPVLDPGPDRIEIELTPCDAAMFGTIRDASGGPIGGARIVRLDPTTAPDGVPGGVGVDSDAAGAYEMCVVPGRWPTWAAISAAGYGGVVIRAAVRGREQFDFELVPEAIVVGRVIRAETGEPVPEAHVSLTAAEPGVEMAAGRLAFSDAEGRFRLDGVAPGRHRLAARAGGMVTESRTTDVLVEAGQETEEITLRLESGATVRGVVREDDRPVEGAHVVARTEDGRSSHAAVSQRDGSFVIDGVPIARVRFGAAPYEVVRPDRFAVERSEHDGVVIEVEPLGAITGQVVRGGEGVAGAHIDIHGPNARELRPIVADTEGRFEARGLRAGRWILFGSSEREGAFGRAEPIALARGQTEEVTIDLSYGASIAGVVVDRDGAPVPGVTVELRHVAADDFGIATTAADGRFRATTMTGGGEYLPSVRAGAQSSAAFAPARGERFPPVVLPGPDSHITGVVLAVRRDRLSIAGRVLDTGGAPIADARVAAEPMSGTTVPRFWRWMRQSAATTDVDGRFVVRDLDTGTYALRARSAAGAEATVTGVVAGSDGVLLALPAPGSIEGMLAGFQTPPGVSAVREGADGIVYGTVTGSSFAIGGLAPGSYIVAARTGAEAAAARVEVAPGSVVRVALASGGSARVAGRVKEFRSGAPVEGITCRVAPRVGAAGEATPLVPRGDGARTDASGSFEIEAAPAGEVAVLCDGIWPTHTSGLRLLDLTPGRRAEVSVPVVRWHEGDVAQPLAGLGAEIDQDALVARLLRVQPGGPTAAAGLRDGDVVVAVDGAEVTELSPFGVWVLIVNRAPGSAVELTVARAGATLTREVVLRQADVP